jgi:hypothetical protein
MDLGHSLRSIKLFVDRVKAIYNVDWASTLAVFSLGNIVVPQSELNVSHKYH